MEKTKNYLSFNKSKTKYYINEQIYKTEEETKNKLKDMKIKT